MAIDRAVFSGKDLDDALQTSAQIVIDRAPTIGRFFDRSMEMRARMSDNIIIDNYHFDVDGAAASTIPVAARADEKADFQTPKEFSLSQQTWKIDKGGENSFKMYVNDIARSSRGRQRILDGQAKMVSYGIADREDDLVEYLDALTVYTTNAPAAADLPLLANTGSNGNAGKIRHVTLGVAANTIDDEDGGLNGNNTAKTATATALVDGLATLRTRIRRRNVGVTEQGRVIAQDPGTFMFLCPPEVGRAYNESLRQLKVQGEALNQDLYRDLNAFSNDAFEFQLNNLASFSSTALPLPDAATDGFDCYLMTPKAVQYAENFINVWSQAPNSAGGVNGGPFYSYHQMFEWGRKLVNPECIIKVTVRSA